MAELPARLMATIPAGPMWVNSYPSTNAMPITTTSAASLANQLPPSMASQSSLVRLGAGAGAAWAAAAASAAAANAGTGCGAEITTGAGYRSGGSGWLWMGGGGGVAGFTTGVVIMIGGVQTGSARRGDLGSFSMGADQGIGGVTTGVGVLTAAGAGGAGAGWGADARCCVWGAAARIDACSRRITLPSSHEMRSLALSKWFQRTTNKIPPTMGKETTITTISPMTALISGSYCDPRHPVTPVPVSCCARSLTPRRSNLPLPSTGRFSTW